jgi:hypothetical protein
MVSDIPKSIQLITSCGARDKIVFFQYLSKVIASHHRITRQTRAGMVLILISLQVPQNQKKIIKKYFHRRYDITQRAKKRKKNLCIHIVNGQRTSHKHTHHFCLSNDKVRTLLHQVSVIDPSSDGKTHIKSQKNHHLVYCFPKNVKTHFRFENVFTYSSRSCSSFIQRVDKMNFI